MFIFAQFYAGLKDTNGTLGPMRGILPCELRARPFAISVCALLRPREFVGIEG